MREILEGPKMEVIEQLNRELLHAYKLIHQLLDIVYLQRAQQEEVPNGR